MGPFNLNIKDLVNLAPDRALGYFRRLLWSEARKVGIGLNLIDVPDCINVGDGGLDAFIEHVKPLQDEVIPTGISGFQIKSSDLQPEKCKTELHIGNNKKKPLKPGIEMLMKKKGTYVLVLFADITNLQKMSREKAIKDELYRMGYKKASVRLYSVNQLIGFIERFPALVALIKGSLRECLAYQQWGNVRDVKHPVNFVSNSERLQIIKDVRENIRKNENESLVYRITALPGIGKTRLIYELLSPPDLQNQVIYIKADESQKSNVILELQTEENINAILVIDDCSLRQHNDIVNSLGGLGKRISIFSLSYETGDSPPPTKEIKFKALDEDTIKEIIKINFPEIAKQPAVVSRISEFADGYPRIAYLLSKSYTIVKDEDKDRKFISLSDTDLINRLICGRELVTSEHFKNSKKILTALSIFTKIGYRDIVKNESEWLADYFKIEYGIFKEIVEEQKQRGIIQGDYYITVTPFMLRIALIREWWSKNSFDKKGFEKFVGIIPENIRADLLKRFTAQMPYISSVDSGSNFIKEILSVHGVFSDGKMLETEFGTDFFLKLAEAEPEDALECLERTIGNWDKEKLLKLKIGRMNIVWALERIVIWENLFIRGARILLKLAEAENEKWSNNATGTFADLFSLGQGELAPTEASPNIRFIVLEESINSSSEIVRKITINAFDKALESQFFTKDIGPEYQGLKKMPNLWKPKVYREIFNAYRFAWNKLYSILDNSQNDERSMIVKVLLNRASGLVRILNLSEMVIDTLDELASKEYIDKTELNRTITWLINHDIGLPLNLIEKLKVINKKVLGDDVKDILTWYLGHNPIETGNKDRKQQQEIKQTKIVSLANEFLNNIEYFKNSLSWLLTDKINNIHLFGYEIAKLDIHFSNLSLILELYSQDFPDKGNLFLMGYLNFVFEKEPQKWETIILELINKQDKYVVNLISGSGLSDIVLSELLKFMKLGKLNNEDLRFFYYGPYLDNLSEKKFSEMINYMSDTVKLILISAALNYVNNRYVFKKKSNMPLQPTLKLLKNPLLFEDHNVRKYSDMIEYDWQEILTEFLKKYPNESVQIANIMLSNFGVDGNIVGRFHNQQKDVLVEIAKINPKDVWDILKKYLGPPIDSRAFDIKSWLRGESGFSSGWHGALSLFPINLIWDWVEDDIEKRAWYLSNFVPPVLYHSKDSQVCFARELLVKYGERDDVRNELFANFYSEGWSGPGSLHYLEKIKGLREFQKKEINQNVITWIDDFISQLAEYVKREKISEERGYR